MAQITITIPDDKVTRVVAALCGLTGAEPTAANAKQVLVQHLRRLVLQYEADHAADDLNLT